MKAAVMLLLLWACFVVSHAKTIRYMSYAEIVEELHDLQQRYPRYVKVFDAQSRWQHVPVAAKCKDGHGGRTDCLQVFVHITDHQTLDGTRPEVFFSGNLHGNEQVGPMALIYTAKMLAQMRAEGSNAWINRMVDTRSIFMLPVSNAIGYDNNVREENGIDPNRDFPYGRDPRYCMRTAVGRAINELWREHMFQLSLTFHGGMQAIAYEWGAPNHESHGSESPDDAAQASLAKVMRQYAGAFKGQSYPTGRLNPLVYPVTGGMEDWAYAASWDTSSVHACKPTTFNGYPESQTHYTNDMLRAFNFLIEAWDDKRPRESELGTDQDMLAVGAPGDGHVARNLRLTMFFIDLVQPYIQWTSIQSKTAPSQSRRLRGAEVAQSRRLLEGGDEAFGHSEKHDVSITYDSQHTDITLTMTWDVSGGLTVDDTHLVWGVYDGSSTVEGLQQDPQWSQVLDGAVTLPSNVSSSKSQSAVTGWSAQTLVDRSRQPYEDRFRACLTFSPEPRSYVVVARAKMDQNWKVQHNPTPGNMAPQSHVVNARTNPSWNANNNGHTLKGRLYWVSQPVFVHVTPSGNAGSGSASEAGSQQGSQADSQEGSQKGSQAGSQEGSTSSSDANSGQGSQEGSQQGSESGSQLGSQQGSSGSSSGEGSPVLDTQTGQTNPGCTTAREDDCQEGDPNHTVTISVIIVVALALTAIVLGLIEYRRSRIRYTRLPPEGESGAPPVSPGSVDDVFDLDESDAQLSQGSDDDDDDDSQFDSARSVASTQSSHGSGAHSDHSEPHDDASLLSETEQQ